MRWTLEQEQVLYLYGNRGPEYCRDHIYGAFGIYRTVEATKRHAARIKASMTRYQTCPVCGEPTRKLNRFSGLCGVCNYEYLLDKQIKEERRIRAKLQKGGVTDEELELKRKYKSQQRRNERLRQRCGD